MRCNHRVVLAVVVVAVALSIGWDVRKVAVRWFARVDSAVAVAK